MLLLSVIADRGIVSGVTQTEYTGRCRNSAIRTDDQDTSAWLPERGAAPMTQFTRRSWINANAAAAAAACAAYIPERAYARQQGKIILSHVLRLNQPDRLKLCLQMGVTHVVSTPSLSHIGADQYEAAMQKHKEDWAEAGFKVAVYETMTPVPAENIRRGTPGREQELRN